MASALFGWLLTAAVAGALWFSLPFVVTAAKQHVRMAAASVIPSALPAVLTWVLMVLIREMCNRTGKSRVNLRRHNARELSPLRYSHNFQIEGMRNIAHQIFTLCTGITQC